MIFFFNLDVAANHKKKNLNLQSLKHRDLELLLTLGVTAGADPMWLRAEAQAKST